MNVFGMQKLHIPKDARATFTLLTESGHHRFAWLLACDLVQEEARNLLFHKRAQEGWLTDHEAQTRRVEFRCCYTASYVNRLDLWPETIRELEQAGILTKEQVSPLLALEGTRAQLLRRDHWEAQQVDAAAAQAVWQLLEDLTHSEEQLEA